MCIRSGLKVGRLVAQAILRRVEMSGCAGFAKSGASSAANARIKRSCRFRKRLCAGISPARTSAGCRLSWACIRCCAMSAADFSRWILTATVGATMRWRIWRRVRGSTCPPRWSARVRHWRACLGFLRRRNPRNHRPQTRRTHPHRDDGSPPRSRPEILRPFLSQPRHAAKRRLRQPHRAATAKSAA